MSESNIIRSTLPKDTTFDIIFAHYVDGTKLSEKEEEIKQRWETAHSLIMNFHGSEQAVGVLRSKYGYGRATAFRDISNAIKLFGDVTKTSKEGIRHILYEYSMRVFQLAANMRPPNLTEMNKAIKNMADIKALAVTDPDLPIFENLQPHQYDIVLPPEILKVVMELVKTGAINLSELREKAKTIDITHDEMKDGESKPNA